MIKQLQDQNAKWHLKIWVILIYLATPLFSNAHFQNNIEINGTVLDETGNPLGGATVTVKNTATTTTTNETGNFSIKVPENGAVLVISFVGYENYEVAADQSPLNIIMTRTGHTSDEVVIIGYGTQKKSNLTGSVSSVNVGKLNDIPVSNLSNALAGRAPGVNVTNTSGLAGASSRIRIRGSFRDPLYVIDGIIKEKSDFDALDPNEIDQMSMLKDAATASIYGSRAGNGVIVITTKKGSAQKPSFNFQTSYTVAEPTKKLLANLTTAKDELIYQNRVEEFLGRPAPNGPTEFAYFEDKHYNVNDWIWRKPTTQKYMLSVSGGSEKIQYYTLLGYTGEKGSYVNLDYGKFNIRSNVTAKLTNAITLNVNIGASQQNHDRFFWPFSPDDDYNVADLYRVTFNWPKLYPFYTDELGNPANTITPYPVQTPMGSWQAWNVIDQVTGDRYINTRKRQANTIATLDFNLNKITEGLGAKLVANYEANDYMRKWYMTFQNNYVFNQADPDNNRFIPGPPDPNKINVFTFSNNAPFLRYNVENGWKYQLNAYLTYNRRFGNHHIDATGIFEQAQNRLYNVSAQRNSPITSIDQMYAYSNAVENREANGYERVGARHSWIGRASYNYSDKYIAEFSFRYDGNPLFSPEKRWGFFPSISLAWRVSQESFFDNVSWLSDLKVRASYGSTGNDIDVNSNNIPAFSYLNRFQNAGGYIFGDQLYNTITPGATPNPFITWATIRNFNVGIDFATLQSRLSGKLDFFVNKMENILGSRTVTIPDSYGQVLAPENYAARSFRGGEIELAWRDVIGTNITYGVYANMGYAKDRWDILDEGPQFQPGGVQHWQTQVGYSSNRLIGLKALGIIRTQEQLDKLIADGFTQYGRKPYLGAILYEDIRGDNYADGADGKIDNNDYQVLSNNGNPRINYGLGFNVGWKGFTIDAHFQGVGAYDRLISNLDGLGMRQHGGNFRVYYPIWANDVWTPETPDAKYPRPVGSNWQESGTGPSSFWLRNGAYLRLRNLNIGYNLPGLWMQKLSLQGAQIFLNGTNLFTVSKMNEFHDPEQDNYDSYPVMKTFTIGLNLRF